jgi:uroporphyrinogen-III decarboxylase
MTFFGEKFFEADPFTQSLSQAKFMNSDIITLPIVGFPGCYDIFCEKLYEGEDYILSKTPFGGIHYWRKKPYFAKILHSPVRTEDDLRSIPPIELSRYDAKIRDFSELARRLGERGYFILAEIKGPFEAPWMFLRGLTTYLMDLARNPNLITRMIEVSFKPIMDLAERVAEEAPIDGIWVTDDLGETRTPFLSVEKYGAIYKPWHKQLVDRLHKKGTKVFLHSHGNVMPLVGEFVDDGFDSLDPLDPSDCMRLSELKAQYGDRITLTGRITKHIGTMTPEEISGHIEQIVRTAGPDGLILNCAGGIPPEMSLEKYMQYVAAIEKLRRP